VILDADLAAVYGVPTKRLNEQVRRNRTRFPVDFMFRLEPQEVTHLRSQIATSNDPDFPTSYLPSPGRGGRRYAPYAFTEHGALMAATVLNSPDRAARAFAPQPGIWNPEPFSCVTNS
jgi:hypothetical protein